jgi:hypothetical protein
VPAPFMKVDPAIDWPSALVKTLRLLTEAE